LIVLLVSHCPFDALYCTVTEEHQATADSCYTMLLILSDADGVFAADLGNLHESSAGYSGMRICWRTLPSANNW